MTDDYSNFRPGTFSPQHRKRLAREAALDMAQSRTPEQLAALRKLSAEPCPTDPRFTHLAPPSLAHCVRPGCTATITQEPRP